VTPEQIEQLYDLAKEREEKALLQVKQARLFVSQHKQQLEALYHYRKEYMDEFNQKQQRGGTLNVGHYQSYHQFLHQIDQAIVKQQDAMPQVEQHLKQALDIWQALHQKCKAFEMLADKQRDAQFLQDEHYEQTLQDEFVTLQYQSRRSKKR
tara:strand:- start:5637 stop:6092 length:456 start_codon:yes stop_codon:yes gene_type:complete